MKSGGNQRQKYSNNQFSEVIVIFGP